MGPGLVALWICVARHRCRRRRHGERLEIFVLVGWCWMLGWGSGGHGARDLAKVSEICYGLGFPVSAHVVVRRRVLIMSFGELSLHQDDCRGNVFACGS